MPKRRTDQQIFLDKLESNSGNNQRPIGNKAFRDILGWQEERYNKTKDQLKESGRIVIGKGHGGSVALPEFADSKALTLFISYSHVDTEIMAELVKHLEPLKKLKLVKLWHDLKITPGEEWEESISANLAESDIILLLVSIDFINSRYCHDIELDQALDQHDQKKSTVIPIIVRNCLWQSTKFAKYQALPRDGKAICSFADKDEAYACVAEGIKAVAEQILSSRQKII